MRGIPTHLPWPPIRSSLCGRAPSGADTEVRPPATRNLLRGPHSLIARSIPSPGLSATLSPTGARAPPIASAPRQAPPRPTVPDTQLRRARSTARLAPAHFSRPPAAANSRRIAPPLIPAAPPPRRTAPRFLPRANVDGWEQQRGSRAFVAFPSNSRLSIAVRWFLWVPVSAVTRWTSQGCLGSSPDRRIASSTFQDK
jgi:hypothetical protein